MTARAAARGTVTGRLPKPANGNKFSAEQVAAINGNDEILTKDGTYKKVEAANGDNYFKRVVAELPEGRKVIETLVYQSDGNVRRKIRIENANGSLGELLAHTEIVSANGKLVARANDMTRPTTMPAAPIQRSAAASQPLISHTNSAINGVGFVGRSATNPVISSQNLRRSTVEASPIEMRDAQQRIAAATIPLAASLKEISEKHTGDADAQFVAVRDFLYEHSDEVYENYLSLTGDRQEALGLTIAFVARSYNENTRVKYRNGSFNNYYARSGDEDVSTYDGGQWRWNKDPLARYRGNSGNPELDCSAFVGLVLDTAGVRQGTDGIQYPAVAGLNLIGPATNNGVRNITHRSDLLKGVKASEARVGDIAFTGDQSHILIVTGVSNGKAVRYTHSSAYDYNRNLKNKIGIQESNFAHASGVRYMRVR